MPTTDRKIGRYLLLEPIGRGAMGVVYRAEDPLIHRVVAVKVLHAGMGLEPERLFVARERFRREAQAAGGIDHPHIVRIFDVGDDKESGELYIVMEYLSGPSLERMIEEATLTIDRSVEIIGQIASGLDAAHERQIVHRDVKPSNILFTERGTAKIVDFGITQIASSSLTQDLSKLGTPAYMSPEQVNGRPLDARADLFSLGVLSYEVLTGKKPFGGTDLMAIAYAISHEDPVRISVANTQLPPSLDRVFALMMAKDPDDRFRSGSVFHEAVVRCLNEAGPTRRPARAVSRRRSNRTPWTFAGAVLVMVAALAAYSGRELISSKTPPVSAAVHAPVPAIKPKPPVSAVKAPVPTAKLTISLTHRVRNGTLAVTLDGRAIFNERFSKARLAIAQTTTWDPVQVTAGSHRISAKLTAEDGSTYVSGVSAIELPRAGETTLRIKVKGDKLVVETS